MSLAEETREAVRKHPFLQEALRAGVVNYTAAARFIGPDVVTTDEDGHEAIATALRRFEESLPEFESTAREARVTMKSGLGHVDEGGLLVVGTARFGSGGGSLTAIVATGDVRASSLGGTLQRLSTAEVKPVAAGGSDGSLIVVVERRDGPDALRAVEDALKTVVLTQ